MTKEPPDNYFTCFEREFLEQRLQTVRTQFDEAALRLSKFSSKNMTFDPQVQGKAMLEAASTLQGQLVAETELSGLQQIYGPENARVKSAAARVGELRSKLRGLSGADGASRKLVPSPEQLPLLGNTYYDLARQAKIDEAVYEALTKQYELAKVQEAKEVPSIRVLDEPVVPEKKVWPPRLIIILFGTLLTLILRHVVLRRTRRLRSPRPRRPAPHAAAAPCRCHQVTSMRVMMRLRPTARNRPASAASTETNVLRRDERN